MIILIVKYLTNIFFQRRSLSPCRRAKSGNKQIVLIKNSHKYLTLMFCRLLTYLARKDFEESCVFEVPWIERMFFFYGDCGHIMKGGPNFFFWVAILGKLLFTTNRLRITNLQYKRLATCKIKYAALALRPTKIKFIEGEKVWNKSCWKWFKLLFHLFYFDEIWKWRR